MVSLFLKLSLCVFLSLSIEISPESQQAIKQISSSFFSIPQSEGDGAIVRRIIGSENLTLLDPFLMLDHFDVTPPAGFPDHPHRGFETVTYMLSGTCIHEDFNGNKGEIHSGDIQWMTAGRGIVHAEMPKDGNMKGIQLWVNLEAKYKLIMPEYQDKLAKDILKSEKDGVTVKIIAGKSRDLQSELITRTPVYFLDIEMNENTHFEQEIPKEWNSLIYILSGTIKIAEKTLKEYEAGIFSKSGNIISIRSNEKSNFILLAGKEIGESVIQHGPFVMNNYDEIRNAISDYNFGKNGFEKAKKWRSSFYDL